jgi:thiamine-phosphate pyrophosphorylase
MMGPVYVITDPGAALPVPDQVRAAARGGAAVVQIRDKRAADAELAALVAMLLPELALLGVRLVVNDRVEVARAAGAHGVHIGQGDGDPAAVRARIGPGMLLGLSVETEAQAGRIPAGVDYIGAGPVRATASKPDHAPPVGFDGLARIVAAAGLPAYAIGGIGPGDAAAAKAAGAAGIAVVSAVTQAPDARAATRALLAEWRAA